MKNKVNSSNSLPFIWFKTTAAPLVDYVASCRARNALDCFFVSDNFVNLAIVIPGDEIDSSWSQFGYVFVSFYQIWTPTLFWNINVVGKTLNGQQPFIQKQIKHQQLFTK